LEKKDKKEKLMSLKGISVASLTNPDKDGYLTKQGGHIKTWKKRWCVLKDGTIFYFTSPKDTTPKGTIDLEKSSKISDTNLTKKKHAFQVQTLQRTFVICAESDSTKRDWMTSIQNAIDNLNKGGGAAPKADGGGSSTPAKPETNGEAKKDPKPEEGGMRKDEVKPEPSAGDATKKKAGGGKGISPRTQLSLAKGCIPFLQEEESKVLEFWQIWSESIPSADDLGAGMSIDFHVFTSASMQKLTWRTAGPQNIFIQRMVDFFWNVGAPESEIDRLNDVGALINPVKIGSWIDMSGKGGMDGGWYFPVEIPLSLAMEAADPGEPTNKVKEWAQKHSIDKCFSIGRDMGAAPPRQTEMRLRLPGGDVQAQLKVAFDAFEMFGFPALPDDALQTLKESATGQLLLSIITSSEGFVRLGVLVPNPSTETVVKLCDIAGGNKDDLAAFEGALGSDGPAFAEYQYLMKGFGYSVYKEGFDIVFHYNVGEERGADD
jgi:hypothetical protein